MSDARDRAHDERLRQIARNAVPTGVYSGNVLALRAVWDAAIASRPVPDWGELVEFFDRAGMHSRRHEMADALLSLLQGGDSR